MKKFFAELELPAKLKIGVSGCPICCGESYLRDIGVIGKKKGWTVVFGGNAGGRPRVGDILAENRNRDEVIDLVGRCLEYYRANAKKRERTARFIERTGIEGLKSKIGD